MMLAVLVVVTTLAAQAQKTPIFQEDKIFRGAFMPISPIDFDQPVEVVRPNGQTEILMVKQLVFDKSTVLRLLPNESVAISLGRYDANGQINYGPASVAGEVGTYVITVDYAKFATQKIEGAQGECSGFAKLGVAVRFTANIQTTKAGINLGSLFALGVAATGQQLSGTMSLDVIGIEGEEVTNLIPMPMEVSQSAIQNILQAISVIKAKIYRQETRLYPQILAVQRVEGTCEITTMVKKVSERLQEPFMRLYLDADEEKTLGPLFKK